LNRINLHARVDPNTPGRLKEIAAALGYVYDDGGSTGQLLDAIADGSLILIAANKSSKSG
jgi:hypothetical protein